MHDIFPYASSAFRARLTGNKLYMMMLRWLLRRLSLACAIAAKRLPVALRACSEQPRADNDGLPYALRTPESKA